MARDRNRPVGLLMGKEVDEWFQMMMMMMMMMHKEIIVFCSEKS